MVISPLYLLPSFVHACLQSKSLQSHPTLCDSTDCSPPGSSVHGILQARILEWVVMPSSRGMPGFCVLHYLPEFAEIHVHWVDDAIQPTHPLPPLSPCALSLSQNQGLFQCLASSGQSIGTSASASVLPKNIQGWLPLRLTGLMLLSEGLSRVFSTTRFENISSLVLSILYGPSLTSLHATGKTIALTRWTFVSKVMSLHFNTLSGFS